MSHCWNHQIPLKPFLVSNWYRPLKSSPDLFSTFDRIIDQTDAENLELYLMGDLNCNLLSEVVSNNSSHLLNIIDIYGLTPLVTEPTRVTQYSSIDPAWQRTITQMKRGTFGNTWQRVSLISMHHWEQKVLKTNALPGLLMNCCVKYIKEIF